jgi:hypothetical protein
MVAVTVELQVYQDLLEDLEAVAAAAVLSLVVDLLVREYQDKDFLVEVDNLVLL